MCLSRITENKSTFSCSPAHFVLLLSRPSIDQLKSEESFWESSIEHLLFLKLLFYAARSDEGEVWEQWSTRCRDISRGIQPTTESSSLLHFIFTRDAQRVLTVLLCAFSLLCCNTPFLKIQKLVYMAYWESLHHLCAHFFNTSEHICVKKLIFLLCAT